jgi:CheY-like chemotaxis protein
VTGNSKSQRELPTAAERIVFVIDDDAGMRETLSSLFRSVGLRVELYGSAREFAQINKIGSVCRCRWPGSMGIEATFPEDGGGRLNKIIDAFRPRKLQVDLLQMELVQNKSTVKNVSERGFKRSGAPGWREQGSAAGRAKAPRTSAGAG